MIQNYKQTDPRWAGMLIGQGSMTMAEGGCGVCAIADVVSVLPPVVADYMEMRGYIYPDAGTVHEGVVPTLEHYGISGRMLTPGYVNGKMTSVYFSEAYDHVAKGFCAIFLMGGTQTNAGGRCRTDFWSKKGHYICICGARNGGELHAYDPAWAARDGWHSIVDYGGAYADSFNGNIKKIWLTGARWPGSGGGTDFMFSVAQIKKGDHGVDVLLLQEILKARGIYTGDLDQSFGNATEAAVIAYQKSRSLQVDGVCGPATWRDLLGK